jgi:histidine triad (HIT) family protein
MKTLFQKIIDKEEPAKFLYEDAEYIIIDNKYPKTPVHYLIIPKKPIESLSKMIEKDKEIVGGMFLLASKFAKENNFVDYKLVFNHGKHQNKPHLHLHFLAGDMEY